MSEAGGGPSRPAQTEGKSDLSNQATQTKDGPGRLHTLMAGAKARLGRLWATLRLVWTGSEKLTLALLLTMLLGVALPLLVAYVGKALVDAVVAHHRGLALKLVGLALGLLVLT